LLRLPHVPVPFSERHSAVLPWGEVTLQVGNSVYIERRLSSDEFVARESITLASSRLMTWRP